MLDSLKADGLEDTFVGISQRIYAWSYASTAVGVPIAILLVKYVNLGSTLVADGVLSGIGALFAFQLVEAPQSNGSQEAIRLSAWHSMRQLSNNAEARWLVALGSMLSLATYLAYWISAPYYQSLGIPVVLFSLILAIRSAWKAWLSRYFIQKRHLDRNMIVYASLAGLVYLAMASRQIWLIWLVLGHDVDQALHGQPITAQLNVHIEHEFRATLNSLANVVKRLLFAISGPMVGFAIDKLGLSYGLIITGIICSSVAFIALAKLHKLQTFKERR